ncbi:hypothetical protein PQR75_42245 [Paraburkholderia fungorum]|jgi:hypothetical protein|uniref:hypothetical protein n=1 Tax=Paraburkholderia TaxID=1822464 RepID=UPI0038BCCB06
MPATRLSSPLCVFSTSKWRVEHWPVVSIHRVSAPPTRARAMDREAFALRADAESAGSTADQFDAMTERTIGLLRSESGASC